MIRKAISTLCLVALGVMPLVTAATCDPVTGAWDFFRDDDYGDYYYDDYYYDDYYYYDDCYYDCY